jgi:hypothetical protein
MTVKKILLSLLLTVLSVPMLAANPRFSVLTCAPGNEAYSLFGHTGLRFCDNEKGIDVVFNYGYFDFDAPNFIWRFIIGETDYMVGTVAYDDFCREYTQRGSAVYEQPLFLHPSQEELLFVRLVENTLPKNRVYRYNYFYNNCTTKIRDKITDVADNIEYRSMDAGLTFRDALNEMLAGHPWYAFGINLLLGSDVDRPATLHELQFIPQNFMNSLDGCRVAGPDGDKIPFVGEKLEVVPAVQSSVAAHSNLTPFNVSLLLLLATFVVMLCEVRSKRTYWGYDVILMTLQGLAGCMLLFMALFSQHPAVGNNWLLLLLNPLALLLMPVLVYRIRKHKSLYAAWVQVAFVLLFFISAAASLQVYPTPIYFCAAALLVRSLFLIHKESICELSRF